MGSFSILTMLLSPKEANKQEKKTHQDDIKFVTKDFICGTILVSLMLSSLFCYISISPALFMNDYGLNTFNYSVVFPYQFYFSSLETNYQKSKKYQIHGFYFL